MFPQSWKTMFYFGSFNFKNSATWLTYYFHPLYKEEIYFSIILELFHRKNVYSVRKGIIWLYLSVSYKIFMHDISFTLIMWEWFSCLLQMLFWNKKYFLPFNICITNENILSGTTVLAESDSNQTPAMIQAKHFPFFFWFKIVFS